MWTIKQMFHYLVSEICIADKAMHMATCKHGTFSMQSSHYVERKVALMEVLHTILGIEE